MACRCGAILMVPASVGFIFSTATLMDSACSATVVLAESKIRSGVAESLPAAAFGR